MRKQCSGDTVISINYGDIILSMMKMKADTAKHLRKYMKHYAHLFLAVYARTYEDKHDYEAALKDLNDKCYIRIQQAGVDGALRLDRMRVCDL